MVNEPPIPPDADAPVYESAVLKHAENPKTTQLTKINECLLRTNLKFTKSCTEKLEPAHGNLDNHKRTDIIGMQLVENRNVCFT